MRFTRVTRGRAFAVVALAPLVAWAAALTDCSSSGASGSGFGGDSGTTHSSSHASGSTGTSATASGSSESSLGPLCTDCDHDGYTVAQGDCNDNDPLINPDAYDFIGDNIDNDCDGVIDDPVVVCNTIPVMAPGTPLDFARTADLCGQKAPTHTGKPFDPVINAVWGEVSGYGTGQTLWTSMTKPEQISIVSSFGGNKPQLGPTMFGLSNGPWGATAPRTSPALDPVGFNLTDACSDIPLLGDDCLALTGNMSASGVSVQDWAELTLYIAVPVNVGGMTFDFSFFSSEFNQWWQSSANDAFFALVTSDTIKGANVAKDSHGFAITVNSGFFELCPEFPGPSGVEENQALEQCVGLDGSSAVPGTLAGTGYDGAGSSLDAAGATDTVLSVEGQEYVYGGGTGWLTASFPVTPSTATTAQKLELRLVIMDTFDGIKDSMVVIDHFTWLPPSAAPASAGVTRPPK